MRGRIRGARIAIAATLAGVATSALAGDPYYFHKPQVAREAYMADVEECARLSGGVRVEKQTIYSANPYQQMASAFFAPLFAGAERRRVQSRVERTCMADKGYRRMAVDKDVLSAIRKLEGKERLDRLFALASAAVPVGKEMPE